MKPTDSVLHPPSPGTRPLCWAPNSREMLGRVILFGAMSKTRIREWSDIDLVVVERTELRFKLRSPQPATDRAALGLEP